MIFAWLGLVEQRVVLLLLPAMAVRTTRHVLAALVVLGDECARPPVAAVTAAVVLEQSGLPPEVLPVVRVDALGLVVFFVVRAPLSLEVEHVEVGVALHLLDQAHFELLGTVRERAVLAVVTFVQMFGILGAKLGLVLLWMVYALNAVVGHQALLLAVAVVGLVVVANIRGIQRGLVDPREVVDVRKVEHAPLILQRVVELAVFVVVLLSVSLVTLTFFNFKFGQIKIFN